MNKGRPTKYKEEYIDLVPKYLDLNNSVSKRLPTREGMSHYIGVHRDTLDEWCRVYPEFSDAIKAIDECQQLQLMNDGMYGGKAVNTGMAIFLLKVNHGMVETEKQILTGDSTGAPIEVIFKSKNDI